MKKVFALVLAAVMMLSVAALAEVPSVPAGPAVISVEPATVDVAVPVSETSQSIAAAIEEAGMDAFGFEGASDYSCLFITDITVAGFDSADGTVTIQLSVPGVAADNEVVVMLGAVEGDNVAWTNVEVVAVEEGIVTIALDADMAAAVQAGTAVLAILVK